LRRSGQRHAKQDSEQQSLHQALLRVGASIAELDSLGQGGSPWLAQMSTP